MPAMETRPSASVLRIAIAVFFACWWYGLCTVWSNSQHQFAVNASDRPPVWSTQPHKPTWSELTADSHHEPRINNLDVTAAHAAAGSGSKPVQATVAVASIPTRDALSTRVQSDISSPSHIVGVELKPVAQLMVPATPIASEALHTNEAWYGNCSFVKTSGSRINRCWSVFIAVQASYCSCSNGDTIALDCRLEESFSCEALCAHLALTDSRTSETGTETATVTTEDQHCVAWRESSECQYVLGSRDAANDASCSEEIARDRAGFCECGKRLTVQFGCKHPVIQCQSVCEDVLRYTATMTKYHPGSSLQRVGSLRSKFRYTRRTSRDIRLCVGWYHENDCEARLVTRSNKNCISLIVGDAGYCECIGHDGAPLQIPFPCGHKALRCVNVCSEMIEGYFRGANRTAVHLEVESSDAQQQDCNNLVGLSQTGFCKCNSNEAPVHGVAHAPFTCTKECARLESSQRVIKLGYELMRSFVVLFVALTRDKANVLPATISWVEKTAENFKNYHVLVLEEDSVDETPQILKEWALRNTHVIVETRKEGSRSAISQDTGRFIRLAALRNRYLERLNDPIYKNVDFVAVFDSDLSLGWDVDGIAHSFGLLTQPISLDKNAPHDWKAHKRWHNDVWDAVCANGVIPGKSNKYYDSLAYLDISFGLHNFREHQEIVHHQLDSTYPVRSCFGGIVIYRKHVLERCQYDILDDTLEWNCEHHGLHQCMLENQMKLVFNPRQVVYYGEKNKK